MKKCVVELGESSGRELFFKFEESTKLMSSMNNLQLAIIQIHVFLRLAIDCEMVPDTFLGVFKKMTRMRNYKFRTPPYSPTISFTPQGLNISRYGGARAAADGVTQICVTQPACLTRSNEGDFY